ncbi:MAG: hypothetical protein WBD56_12205 [Anaerolineales bacterium]
MNDRRRFLILSLLICVAIVIVGTKAFRSGWFAPRRPLDLNGKPALLFFNVSRGCECQMVVSNNANAQIASWSEQARHGIPVFKIDIERRPDLAEQYDVFRVPVLILLDGQGRLMWKQDYSINDDLPLDLNQFELEIQFLYMQQ